MNNEVKQGVLSLTIKDRAVLYAAYMPFIQNGGLFVPTNKQYALGDEVFILLSLMDEAEKIPITGQVVWITPKGARAIVKPALACSFLSKTSPLPPR